MNLAIRRLTLALTAALAVTGSYAAEPAKSSSNKPVATVNGTAIPAIRADVLVASQASKGQQVNDQLREAVREELIKREIITAEAKKSGVGKRPEVAAQMEMAGQAVLIDAYLQNYRSNHLPSDEAVKKEYDAFAKNADKTEYKARHVLVEKEETAKEIIASLKKGEKFETLAKQSKDPGSKDKGGDLGWSMPSNYVPPFAEALKKLAKGKYTETPVKSDFGYHVILLEDSRDVKLPTLEEVKPQIQQHLANQAVQKHVADLRAKAKVE